MYKLVILAVKQTSASSDHRGRHQKANFPQHFHVLFNSWNTQLTGENINYLFIFECNTVFKAQTEYICEKPFLSTSISQPGYERGGPNTQQLRQHKPQMEAKQKLPTLPSQCLISVTSK